jgi:hypothetical protein
VVLLVPPGHALAGSERRHSAARGARCYARRVPELLATLDAFAQEHRRGGHLDGRVEGGWVRPTCECGAELVRRADEG